MEKSPRSKRRLQRAVVFGTWLGAAAALYVTGSVSSHDSGEHESKAAGHSAVIEPGPAVSEARPFVQEDSEPTAGDYLAPLGILALGVSGVGAVGWTTYRRYYWATPPVPPSVECRESGVISPEETEQFNQLVKQFRDDTSI